MAMTAEEQKAFDEAKAAVAEAAKAKAELEEYKKNNPPKPKEDDPSILEAARKKEQEENERKEKERVVTEAAKFNVSVKGIVGDPDNPSRYYRRRLREAKRREKKTN